MNHKDLPRLAFRHWLFWAVDMVTAILGWIYGFGMEVKNWWALIGLMLIARWLCFVMFAAHNHAIARQQVHEEIKAQAREGGAA